jgi:hypothetical protein
MHGLANSTLELKAMRTLKYVETNLQSKSDDKQEKGN